MADTSNWMYKHWFSKSATKLDRKKRLFYSVWVNMKTRCYNKKSSAYHRYWWRWITMSDEWQDFQNFYNDMHEWYEVFLQIDRIDNNKWYNKDNCKWATRKEQARNRRTSKFLEYNWERLTLVWWAEKIWIKRSTLAQRYYCMKWSVEKCLTYNT